jgi:hypothetical protein
MTRVTRIINEGDVTNEICSNVVHTEDICPAHPALSNSTEKCIKANGLSKVMIQPPNYGDTLGYKTLARTNKKATHSCHLSSFHHKCCNNKHMRCHTG